MPLDEVPETTELQEMTERKEKLATREEEYQINSSSNVEIRDFDREIKVWHPDYLILPNARDEARRQYYIKFLDRGPKEYTLFRRYYPKFCIESIYRRDVILAALWVAIKAYNITLG